MAVVVIVVVVVVVVVVAAVVPRKASREDALRHPAAFAPGERRLGGVEARRFRAWGFRVVPSSPYLFSGLGL